MCDVHYVSTQEGHLWYRVTYMKGVTEEGHQRKMYGIEINKT
jgi:hypothetical protein